MTTDDQSRERIDPVSAAITDALAASGGLSLERPLYDVIDPDAIDRLHRHAAARDTTVGLAFEYDDRPIEVRVGRTVDVRVGRPAPDGIALRRSGVGN